MAAIVNAADTILQATSPRMTGVGVRGARTGYGPTFSISSSAWSDSQANAVVSNLLTGGSLTTLASAALNVAGDMVSLSNGSFLQTKMWSGTAWVTPTTVFDGNLLLNSTVNTPVIQANAVTVPVAYQVSPNQTGDGVTTYSYSFSVTLPQAGVLYVSAVVEQWLADQTKNQQKWNVSILIDGVTAYTMHQGFLNVPIVVQPLIPLAVSQSMAAGTHTVTITWFVGVPDSVILNAISAYAMSAMR